ncbi:MAG: NACHT domain-containing protein [Armatimonadetes bacterium]|nr:NACHT domain-containing protein [Armatimonadota bacterium]
MTIKRFEGQYVSDVIAQVRDELGPDAVVLHTRWRQANGLKRLLGRPQVEVWAGANGEVTGEAFTAVAEVEAEMVPEYDENDKPAALDPLAVRALAARQLLAAQMSQSEPVPALPQPTSPAPVPAAPPALPAPADEQADTVDLIDLSPEARQMSREELTVALLAEFNEALERMESKLDDLQTRSRRQDESGPTTRQQALIDAGVDTDVAAELMAAAQSRSVADVLHDTLLCSGDIRLGDEPRVVALIGPSGVGKTSLIAKLAGRFALGQQARVVLVTTDARRVGSQAQLQALGDLLQMPVVIARNAAEAEQKLRVARRHSDLILIDTPACATTQGPAWESVLDTLIALEPDEIHLVLSASTKGGDLRRSVEAFGAALPLAALAITKTDEATDHGLLVNLAWRYQIPFSYLGTGADIPDDLELATSAKLVQLAWSKRIDLAQREA